MIYGYGANYLGVFTGLQGRLTWMRQSSATKPFAMTPFIDPEQAMPAVTCGGALSTATAGAAAFDRGDGRMGRAATKRSAVGARALVTSRRPLPPRAKALTLRGADEWGGRGMGGGLRVIWVTGGPMARCRAGPQRTGQPQGIRVAVFCSAFAAAYRTSHR